MLKPRTTRLGLIAGALVAVVLTCASGALAERSYTDPAGDSGAAPDITNVAVSHDAAGTVSIAISTTQQTLPPEANFWGYIDTDLNSTTGFSVRGIGAEYFFLADAEGGIMAHVVGNAILFDFNSTFAASYANGVLTAQVARSELGSSEKFALALEGELEDANGNTIASDLAPDGPPYYVYAFVDEALTLGMGKPVGTPATPLAGKAFAVTAPLTRSDGQPFTTAEVTCRAQVGKHALRPVGRLTGNSARCSMRIPKDAKRKVVRGSITVLANHVTVKKPFSFTVR